MDYRDMVAWHVESAKKGYIGGNGGKTVQFTILVVPDYITAIRQ